MNFWWTEQISIESSLYIQTNISTQIEIVVVFLQKLFYLVEVDSKLSGNEEFAYEIDAYANLIGERNEEPRNLAGGLSKGINIASRKCEKVTSRWWKKHLIEEKFKKKK